MVICQGSNLPLIIEFPEDMSEIQKLSILLYTKEKESRTLKEWTQSTVTIEGNTITAELTQKETNGFPAGACYLEAKWIDKNGYTCFSEVESISVVYRHNKTIL